MTRQDGIDQHFEAATELRNAAAVIATRRGYGPQATTRLLLMAVWLHIADHFDGDPSDEIRRSGEALTSLADITPPDAPKHEIQ